MATNSARNVIERIAIDPSGTVGSFYDAHRDKIIQQTNSCCQSLTSKIEKPIHCNITNGDKVKKESLLRMVGIEDDLRLHTLLNKTSRNGIAAISEYPDKIDICTAFFHYYYVNQTKQSDEISIAEYINSYRSLIKQESATHIITGVELGIQVIVVLKLFYTGDPSIPIDNSLNKLQAILKNDFTNDIISSDDEKQLRQLNGIKVYSNIKSLTEKTSLFDIYQFIKTNNKIPTACCPLKYILKSINAFPIQSIGFGIELISHPSTSANELEKYLMDSRNKMNNLKLQLHHTIKHIVPKYLKQPPTEVQVDMKNLENAFEQDAKRITKLINEFRDGKLPASAIGENLLCTDRMRLTDCVNKYNKYIQKFQAKETLITNLEQEHFEYCNASELISKKNNFEQTLIHKTILDNREFQILCTSDALNERYSTKFNTLRQQLNTKHRSTPTIRIIYADFSYCSFELDDIIVLPIDKNLTNGNANNESTIAIPSPPPLAINEIINILLIGESGVGKSTFINAFVNYLRFHALNIAQSNKPIALIPVSFLLTTGDNFEEHLIKFELSDPLNNEDFTHPGQSVTQHCKSYVFDLKETSGTKFRLIDTPGFADTRGIDQDDRNLKHILEYINQFQQINFVCFLLKPNSSRLDIFFRSCITQLIDFLGSNAQQNVIFCFTNGRSTFYSPGDTAPLLRSMLNSLSMNNVQFKKENTFVYDNESFRYLVALQKGIKFGEEEKKEYETGWSISVRETKRFIDYISNQNRFKYSSENEIQTKKRAEIEINSMIRPILESMRNTLRNIVLCDMGYGNQSIELQPSSIHRPASKCCKCKPHPIPLNKFLIIPDRPHEFLNQCVVCDCDSNQHSSIDYIIEYKLLNNSSNLNRKEMDNMIRELCEASNKFGWFLMNVVHSTTDDPFLIGLTNMIDEENILYNGQGSQCLNLKLVEHLKRIDCSYRTHRNENKLKRTENPLSDIYEWIHKMHKNPEVEKQFVAMKESKRNIVKLYEYEVPSHQIIQS